MNNFNYCPNCGQRVDGNPKFCVKCKKNLETSSSDNSNEISPNKKELNNIEIQLIYANNKKSKMLSFFLTLLFGPLGLLYISPISSIILTAITLSVPCFQILDYFESDALTLVSWVERLLVDFVLLFIMYVISIIASILFVDDYNNDLMNSYKNKSL